MSILRIAIKTPIRCLFDYLPHEDCKALQPGQRFRVPFGHHAERIGVLIAITEKSEVSQHKLKKVSAQLDQRPLLSQQTLEFLIWVSEYYHHPIGEVIFTALPSLLRKGKVPTINSECYWRPTIAGNKLPDTELHRAPKQLAVLHFLRNYPMGISQTQILNEYVSCQSTLRTLATKKLAESFEKLPFASDHREANADINLNQAQRQAISTILKNGSKYQTFLLNGVTGSGKTEVYLELIHHTLNNNKQALVLLPEIGLTPQLIQRFKEKFQCNIALIHSAVSEKKRAQAWLSAASGQAGIIIGTRSAIWTPLLRLGIIIVDEEHDLSYKQQEGLRYSARDLALVRAYREKIPLVLGSATPCLESFYNTRKGRYRELKLLQRATGTKLPTINILDIRRCKMHGAIAQPLLNHIKQHLHKGQQILLFLNRRGYAPVMLCHDCAYIMQCPRCNISIAYHKQYDRLRCHQCDHTEKIPAHCPSCSTGSLIEVGHGTERLYETLKSIFPEANILRIDSDSTQRKGSMEKFLENIQTGDADILVGTQMLVKGHHFPAVTLVGIIGIDQGLYSTDYRSLERMAQVIMQVSGRAGRGNIIGDVIIQTHYPNHPLLTTLPQNGYENYANELLCEREQTALPPYSYHALLRAEALNYDDTHIFLSSAREKLPIASPPRLEIYGPIRAPLEKRAGRYRSQLLIQSSDRKQLREILKHWVPKLDKIHGTWKVRWSIDVDPQDMT